MTCACSPQQINPFCPVHVPSQSFLNLAFFLAVTAARPTMKH